MSSTLTAQQHRAVHTREVSVVLSSGAGCGKTHVLTERYLSHLREGVEVGQLVAITFTDRAARQMRGRIRKALLQHLRGAESDADAEVWAGHLRALESAPISTIHAFCGTLLRQHAVEAGLDPRFDVLEEVLAGNLRSEAIMACLQGLLTAATPAADDLRELVLLLGWRVTAETILSLVHDHDARGWQGWLSRSTGEIAEEWLRFAREELLPRHLSHWLHSRPAITRTLALLRRHPPLPGPMAVPVATLLERTYQLPHAADLEAEIKLLAESAKVGRAGSKAWPDPAVYEQIKKAFEDFREDLRKLDAERFCAEAEDLLLGIESGQRFLRVAAEAVGAYREQKHRHGVVDFHDLLVSARDLLRDNAELRAAVQDRYRYLLIDELQDTDPVQMELVEYLGGGALTGGKLFAVGDHKQSIYRFRGADVSLFQDLRRRIPLDGRQTLSVNFRSQPAVLDFVNTLLGDVLEDYEPLAAHHPQRSAQPCTEFLWSTRPEDASVSEARAIEADAIARRLASMIGREEMVSDEQTGQLRPVRAGDVVLLFRAMSNVHLYEAALRRWGLHYYLVGGRAFFAQQEIYDLLNLLRTLENPQDGVSLAGTLRSPFCCLSDEALFALGRHKQGLWVALFDDHTETTVPAGQRERLGRARRLLTGWRRRKDQLPIPELLALIFAQSGYDAAVAMEFLGERKLANLWKLQDLARTFSRSGLFGLAEFIARLGELVAAQPREEQAATQPENSDVVRLMTIHQAKGLEFPVVVIPDVAAAGGSAHYPAAQWQPRLGCVVRPPADEDPAPFPGFGWSVARALDELEEWNEDLRTLYVACTRPKDYLILSAALSDTYQPAGPWMQTLARSFDLRSGACLGAKGPAVRVTDPHLLFAMPPEPRDERASRAAPPPVPELNLRRGKGLVGVEEVVEHISQAGSLFSQASETPEIASEVIRRVLGGWDFRDPEGWSPRLERFARSRLSQEERAKLKGVFGGLAGSPFFQQLKSARAVRRHIEYVLSAGPDGMGVRGVIDCIWQDEKGRWSLLEWVTEPVPASLHEAHWTNRQSALSLAAQAMHGFLDIWPRNVALVFLHGAAAIERPAGRLAHRSVMDCVEGTMKVLQEREGRRTIDGILQETER